ncbi:MAG: hypothetical protein L6Q92_16695, partial [Phycisphaerae bacterium]|nr:hypothetical protein [Phycisphaerae bacterium]
RGAAMIWTVHQQAARRLPFQPAVMDNGAAVSVPAASFFYTDSDVVGADAARRAGTAAPSTDDRAALRAVGSIPDRAR